MTISLIEESEIEEHYVNFTLIHMRKPADGTGTTQLLAPGHHPKVRITRVVAVYMAYSTAGDVFAIEDGDGTDAATCDMTSSPAVGVSYSGTLVAGQVFERNEAVVHNLTTDGNAANAYIAAVQMESIH